MSRTEKRVSRPIVILSLMALATYVLVEVDQQTTASETQRIADEHFAGGGPTIIASDNLNTIRVRVDAGARSNWHSHTWGQLLLVEQGRGRLGLRNKKVSELRPGEPVYTGPNIEHWHGAAPNQSMIMVSTHGNGVIWEEPVGDEIYRSELE